MAHDDLVENQGLPEPPCLRCHGACCRATSGHRFAVMLLPDEPHFEGESVYESAGVRFRVLPYVEATGGCPNLREPGLCAIHDRRPRLCRVFNCRSALRPDGSPGEFLLENPAVYALLQAEAAGGGS